MQIKKVAIFGCGTTGSALAQYLEEKNPQLEIAIRDPDKGFLDNILGAQLAFICVPVPVSENDYTQDLSMIADCLERVHPTTIPIIRSSMAIGTVAKLEKIYNRMICHMPEFLTARRSLEDMFNQKNLWLGYRGQHLDLYSIFPDKEIWHCLPEEAEAIKMFHNCFGAMKVTFFNAVKQYCDFKCVEYESVRKGILNVTGFISPEHTMVPGPDGKHGFGGTCFPVNIRAMIGSTKGHQIQEWMKLTEQQNFYNREMIEILKGEEA